MAASSPTPNGVDDCASGLAVPVRRLWGWATFYLDHDRLPRRRVLVRFEYPTLSEPGSRGWLLIQRGDAEVCEKYPGGEEELVVVVNDPVVFARWHLGEAEWDDALRSGAIDVTGSSTLSRALPLGTAASTRPARAPGTRGGP